MLKAVFLALALAGYSVAADAQDAAVTCASLAHQYEELRQDTLRADDMLAAHASDLEREGDHAGADALRADVARSRQQLQPIGGESYERYVRDKCVAKGCLRAVNFKNCIDQ